MKHHLCLFASVVCICLNSYSAQTTVCDSLFKVLDKEVVNCNKYINQRQAKIDSLIQMHDTATDVYALNQEIYALYVPYKCPDALRYLSENLELAEKSHDANRTIETTIQIGYLLASIGNLVLTCIYPIW